MLLLLSCDTKRLKYWHEVSTQINLYSQKRLKVLSVNPTTIKVYCSGFGEEHRAKIFTINTGFGDVLKVSSIYVTVP